MLKSLAVRTDAYVFRLISAQNNFVYSVPLIILQALSNLPSIPTVKKPEPNKSCLPVRRAARPDGAARQARYAQTVLGF